MAAPQLSHAPTWLDHAWRRQCAEASKEASESSPAPTTGWIWYDGGMIKSQMAWTTKRVPHTTCIRTMSMRTEGRATTTIYQSRHYLRHVPFLTGYRNLVTSNFFDAAKKFDGERIWIRGGLAPGGNQDGSDHQAWWKSTPGLGCMLGSPQKANAGTITGPARQSAL